MSCGPVIELKTLRLFAYIAFGGLAGLVILPLLPASAADWVDNQNRVVNETFDRLKDGAKDLQPTVSGPPDSQLSISESNAAESTDVHGALKDFGSVITGEDLRSLEQMVSEMVNAERIGRGYRAFRTDTKLADVSRDHSEDMAQRGFYDHDNPDGLDPTGRASKAGYTCRKDFGSYYTEGIAENIHQVWTYSMITYVAGIPRKTYRSLDEVAVIAVQDWMDSPGHRENILNGTFDRAGIGVALSVDDAVFLTQNFC